jgi:hypothetical protein
VGAETVRLALADAARQWTSGGTRRSSRPGTPATRRSTQLLPGWTPPSRAPQRRTSWSALSAVQDLVDPLHAFIDAEEAFRRLR